MNQSSLKNPLPHCLYKTKYGFTTGETVETKVDLFDENKNPIKAGSKIRLVAFSAKVRMTRGKNQDSRKYFYNAVSENQEGNYGNRIRENFCTIKKIKNILRAKTN